MSRQPLPGFRPYIVALPSRHGTVFKTALRGAHDCRQHVGTFDTREEALDACAAVLRGEPVRPGKRGPRARRTPPDRIAMMRAILRRIG